MCELPPDPESSPLHFLLHQGLSSIGLGAGLQLLLRTDIFVLTTLGLSRELVGFYGAAAILVWGLLALPQLVALSLYPTVARLASRGHRPSLSALIAVGLGLGIGLSAAAAVVAHSAGAVANFLLAVRPGRIPGEVRAR